MMKRVLCVRLPDWPRQRHAVVPQELELSDREALARAAAWCDAFSPLVGVDTREPPESLFLDVTGLADLFHGEETLLEHIAREFGRRGLTINLALADTLGAAWALANFRQWDMEILVPAGQTLAALVPLPVEGLRLSTNCVETLKELGLRQIGQLLSFSRDSLAARFGPELLLRLDQATGVAAETIATCHPAPLVKAEALFEYPTARQEMIEQALQRQLEQIARQLSPRRQGVQELVCRLRGETGRASEITIGLYRPSASPKHLAELIAMQWEAAHRKLAEPLAALRLSVTAAAPVEYRQQELFEGLARPCDPRQTALLIDRLSSRLGRSSVVRAKLLAEAQPELAWRYEALVGGCGAGVSPANKNGGTGVSPGKAGVPRTKKKLSSRQGNIPSNISASRQPLSRPLSLAARPQPVEVVSVAPHGPPQTFSLSGEQHRVERVWGPERIHTGWWRGRSVRRDYYRVETTTGRWFWLFRQLTDLRWYFHGAFD
jgi:protein ImuB